MKKNIYVLVLALSILIIPILACGGAYSSPKKVAENWVDAIETVDCEEAEAYYSPLKSRKYFKDEYCFPGRVETTDIDDVVTREVGSLVEVIYIGKFTARMNEGGGSFWHGKRKIITEKIDGSWYVAGDIIYESTAGPESTAEPMFESIKANLGENEATKWALGHCPENLGEAPTSEGYVCPTPTPEDN